MKLEEFIKTQIKSVDELRVLLLFHAHPQAEINADEVSAQLYISPASSSAVLTRLAAKGFLIAGGEPARYRFQPQSPELSQLVKELAEFDRRRPVTLISMIYGHPEDVQAFADAFKLKRET
ncbi:MAG TPA: hypothetical protein VGH42_07425 [Verrucomicrobiae bacterium]